MLPPTASSGNPALAGSSRPRNARGNCRRRFAPLGWASRPRSAFHAQMDSFTPGAAIDWWPGWRRPSRSSGRPRSCCVISHHQDHRLVCVLNWVHASRVAARLVRAGTWIGRAGLGFFQLADPVSIHPHAARLPRGVGTLDHRTPLRAIRPQVSKTRHLPRCNAPHRTSPSPPACLSPARIPMLARPTSER